MPPSPSAPIGAGPWIAALIVWLAVAYGLLAEPQPAVGPIPVQLACR